MEIMGMTIHHGTEPNLSDSVTSASPPSEAPRRAVPGAAFMRSVQEIRLRGYLSGYDAGWRDGYAAREEGASPVPTPAPERTGG